MAKKPSIPGTRRIALLIVLSWLCGVALISQPFGAPPAVAAPTSSAEPCANDNNYSIPAAGESRCIAGAQLNTRSRLSSECLTGVLALRKVDHPYAPGECNHGVGRQAEAIAQARAIARMNSDLLLQAPEGARPASGITPDLQWEVILPNGARPDIIYL